MFRGERSINLDAKGRLAIPTKYRSELQESCDCQMIVTVAIDERCVAEEGCLWLYPLPEWEAVELKLSKLPTLHKVAGHLRRFLIGSATECEMDGQGRILLPESLRNDAGLDKQIIFMGQLNKFEIWNKDLFLAKKEQWKSGIDTGGVSELATITF